MPLSSTLLTALSAARAAGRVLRRKFAGERTITAKGPRDIVTDADFAAQRAALAVLRRATPDFAVLAEEGMHAADVLGRAAPTWVLDPLDGTSNYARGLPVFAVSLGLVHRGALQAGVVLDPLGGEVFFAERGGGAFVQAGRAAPRPLRVSARPGPEDLIVGVDWARDPRARRRTLAGVQRVAARCRTVRALGSAALGLAYVAAGRLDAYFHLALQPWDAAGGALLVREAGGRLCAPEGGPWRLDQPELVAVNRNARAAVLDLLDRI